MSEEKITESDKIAKFTEFETKYRTEIDRMIPFKELVEDLPGLIKFSYVQGPDTYYLRDGNAFGRHRLAQYADKDGYRFSQWTIKIKPEGAKNNIKRTEPNWNVSATPPDEVEAGAIAMGYKFNFKIWKMCHIYEFKDATIVFYTVRDEDNKKYDHFIEIEVTEETIHELTEQQAWDVITKYEKILEPVGVNAQKRLRKSLYEMYVR